MSDYKKQTIEVKKSILEKARSVLESNWVELGDGLGFTKPARGLYPFQWNWDAGLISFGHIHNNKEKAVAELRTLFLGQWKNGFLPHIIFHKEDSNYFPNYDFWDSSIFNPQAPFNVKTSGITQPPVASLAVWHIYEVYKDKDVLEEFYPKLFKLHKYFHTARDPEGWGLVTIYHPWESGFDNSPRWDEALKRLEVRNLPAYKRKDLNSINQEFRPTDKEYDKYVYLALELKIRGYDDKKIYSDFPFKIKDKVLSSILYMADNDLLKIAKVLNKDTSEIENWTTNCERNFLDKLWDSKEKMFYDFDIIQDRQIKVKTIAGVMPIITGVLNKEQLSSMSEMLDKSNFCGKSNCAISLAPSVGIKEKLFDENKYWRGPVWININWFLWKAYKRLGMHERAEHLRLHILKLVSEKGFWEYYSAKTGKGLGSNDFSWSAALAIDLIGDDIN